TELWRRQPSRALSGEPDTGRTQSGPAAAPACRRTEVCRNRKLSRAIPETAVGTERTEPGLAKRSLAGRKPSDYHRAMVRRRERHSVSAGGTEGSVPNCAARQRNRSARRGV